MKTAVAAKQPGRNLIGIKDYFSCSRATHTEQSNYFYLNIMDCKADSKDTLHTCQPREGRSLDWLAEIPGF